jgi:glycyl-tRNA synthetase
VVGCHSNISAAGVPPEVMRAVLQERSDDVALAVQSAMELAGEVEADTESLLPQVLTALSRPTRLVKGKQQEAQGEVDSTLLTADDEKKLWTTLNTVKQQIEPGMSIGAWLQAVSALVEPVDSFFTNVLVMDKDERVRSNRLALSRAVAEVSKGVVDLAELPGF